MARGSTSDANAPPWRRPLEELCCVNSSCPDKGKTNNGNLSIRNGKGSGRWRILRCSACKVEFSERKGTALWGTRMSPEKAENIAFHLQEGCGIRKTARLVGASTDGVTSIGIRLGLHAHALHDACVQNIEVREARFDEKWAFVKKKAKEL